MLGTWATLISWDREAAKPNVSARQSPESRVFVGQCTHSPDGSVQLTALSVISIHRATTFSRSLDAAGVRSVSTSCFNRGHYHTLICAHGAISANFSCRCACGCHGRTLKLRNWFYSELGAWVTKLALQHKENHRPCSAVRLFARKFPYPLFRPPQPYTNSSPRPFSTVPDGLIVARGS